MFVVLWDVHCGLPILPLVIPPLLTREILWFMVRTAVWSSPRVEGTTRSTQQEDEAHHDIIWPGHLASIRRERKFVTIMRCNGWGGVGKMAILSCEDRLLHLSTPMNERMIGYVVSPSHLLLNQCPPPLSIEHRGNHRLRRTVPRWFPLKHWLQEHFCLRTQKIKSDFTSIVLPFYQGSRHFHVSRIWEQEYQTGLELGDWPLTPNSTRTEVVFRHGDREVMRHRR